MSDQIAAAGWLLEESSTFRHYGVFAVAVLVVNLTPGADTVVTITRTLEAGTKAGLCTAMGVASGCAMHALAVAMGLTAILAASTAAFDALKWAGAAYLLWIGYTWAKKALSSDGVGEASPSSAGQLAAHGWADVRLGIVTNVLNPKVALFFLAFLPQFINSPDRAQADDILLLGLWFALQSFFYLSVLVWLTSRVRQDAWPVQLRRAVQFCAGLLMAALAVRLSLTRGATTWTFP